MRGYSTLVCGSGMKLEGEAVLVVKQLTRKFGVLASRYNVHDRLCNG
jgi:hypothetical protein